MVGGGVVGGGVVVGTDGDGEGVGGGVVVTPGVVDTEMTKEV